MDSDNQPVPDRLADALAPVMFWLSLVALALVASLLVLWVDVPRTVETFDVTQEAAELLPEDAMDITLDPFALRSVAWGNTALGLLILLWPVFVAEQAWHFFMLSPGESFHAQHRYWWAFCLCPPLRMCARHRGNRERIWLPGVGWQIADYQLLRRLERAFSLPMIGIALLILPVLGLQALYQERISEYPALRAALHVGTGVIWFAFATEYIVMISVTQRKLNYCRTHWLDLVIILLPLISFLRTLRILRAAKLLNLAQFQQLSRLVRVFRLRGVALRGWRALLLLDMIERLLNASPQKQVQKLEEKCAEKERELLLLREKIARIREETQLASKRS